LDTLVRGVGKRKPRECHFRNFPQNFTQASLYSGSFPTLYLDAQNVRSYSKCRLRFKLSLGAPSISVLFSEDEDQCNSGTSGKR
jgi:hypothetical protein